MIYFALWALGRREKRGAHDNVTGGTLLTSARGCLVHHPSSLLLSLSIQPKKRRSFFLKGYLPFFFFFLCVFYFALFLSSPFIFFERDFFFFFFAGSLQHPLSFANWVLSLAPFVHPTKATLTNFVDCGTIKIKGVKILF